MLATDWLSEGASHWKEAGGVGLIVLLLAKVGARAFDWSLDMLGINIKRGQSREDLLAEGMEKLRSEFSEMGKRLTKVEAAYDVTAGICHRCADGIEGELRRLTIDSPTITFFVSQLREVELIEEVFKG
jgi:hypothetical protein